MKTHLIKRIGLALLILIVIGALIPLSLEKEKDRTPNYTPEASLKAQIKEETKGMDEEEILDYSVKLTAHQLSFAMKDDIAKGEANCMGYAQMLAGIANYAYQTNGIDASAKPVVGYVKMLGINVHPLLKFLMPSKRLENFVKDHDFAEFQLADGQVVYADACAYDLLLKKAKTTHSGYK